MWRSNGWCFISLARMLLLAWLWLACAYLLYVVVVCVFEFPMIGLASLANFCLVLVWLAVHVVVGPNSNSVCIDTQCS